MKRFKWINHSLRLQGLVTLLKSIEYIRLTKPHKNNLRRAPCLQCITCSEGVSAVFY